MVAQPQLPSVPCSMIAADYSFCKLTSSVMSSFDLRSADLNNVYHEVASLETALRSQPVYLGLQVTADHASANAPNNSRTQHHYCTDFSPCHITIQTSLLLLDCCSYYSCCCCCYSLHLNSSNATNLQDLMHSRFMAPPQTPASISPPFSCAPSLYHPLFPVLRPCITPFFLCSIPVSPPFSCAPSLYHPLFPVLRPTSM